MSFPLLNIKDFRIITQLINYLSINSFLIEEIQTNKKRIALIFKDNLCTPAGKPSIKEVISNILKFTHPLFTSLYGYSLNDFEGQPSFVLFLHDMPYGSINDILEKERNGKSIPNFSSTKKYIILLGISLGLKYTHSYGISNGHLSSQNIYLDENFYPRYSEMMFFYEMESIFKAPEIINGQEARYSSDVYSFSMIAYELITGQKPFISKGQKRPNLLDIKIESIRAFISKCWSEDPDDRPSFSEIFGLLMKKEFQNYFNVNEEEVSKYLNLFEDKLKNPNFFKQFDINDPITGKSSDEIFIRGINLCQKSGDKKETSKMFKIAAELGNDESMLQYSNCFENGEGVPVNKEESLRFLKMAVDKGNISAYNKYAFKCQLGDGVEKDLQKAIYYYKLAADKGDYFSACSLGNIYMNCNDLNQAAHYLKMAADHKKAEGMFGYGSLLLNHFKDVKKGIEYIKMSADNGMIQAMVAYAYFILVNPEYNEKKKEAARYLKKAAKYGNTYAMMNYGHMLFNGDGIKSNKKKGIQYIRKAADLGNVHAMKIFVYCFISMLKKDENTDEYFNKEEVF